ncbi:MAG: CPBP family intramembrane glutamic endopeptidase [Thermoplasmatota archaeon]
MVDAAWMDAIVAAFPRWSFYAVPWVLALGTAVAARILGTRGLRAVGIGLMTVPLWETFWGILSSIEPLVQGGFTFRSFTRHELSSLYLYKFLEDLGYLGSGFLLYASDGTWRGVFRQTPRSLARSLVALGLPMGQRSEGRSGLFGLLLFPVLLLVTIAVNVVLNGVQQLQQSDESSIYDNMTVYHAVAISLAAGFTEELAYRGLLQTGLSRRMPMPIAIVVQAVFFGFAHSGYGTWVHVILPTLFGLVAGLVAWRFGLWAAIVLHVLVDIIAFGADASGNVPWLWQAIVWAFLVNCGLTVAYAAWWVLRKLEARKVPPTA